MQSKALSVFALMALSSSALGGRLGERSERKLGFLCDNGHYTCPGPWYWPRCGCECDAFWSKDWWGRCTENACPTPETEDNIDLEEWVRATWYIQAQQPNEYQPENKLYCVAATYDLSTDRNVPFYSDPLTDLFKDNMDVSVFNYANEEEVNGTPVNGIPGAEGSEPGLILCGRVPDQNEKSKLLVAPCFLPNALAGDYWILAVGKSAEGKYEWAVVSGGPPTEPFSDGCTTKRDGINGSGLWVFSRKPVDPEGKAAALSALRSKGYTTSQLVDVPQAGCEYTNAWIKPDL